MFPVSSCSCVCPIHWSQVLSQEWICSWSSADIWVINNFIACWGTTYFRGFTVFVQQSLDLNCIWKIVRYFPVDILCTNVVKPWHTVPCGVINCQPFYGVSMWSWQLKFDLPSSLYYKMHLSRQWHWWSLRCSWSIACRCCSNYIFILH